ncbi:6a7eaee1-a19e-4bb7-86ac-c64a5b42be5c [Cladorrhinum sp. PSN332]|nr:6a7eaee1-a19e-4bb7-86ac-c64a5b42be5c [Cladorrhinum sp. PSN332]
MPADIRNELLDAGESDDELARNSDLDDDFQKGGRSAKRRRVTNNEDEDSDVSDHSDDEHGDNDDNDGNENSKPSSKSDVPEDSSNTNTFQKQAHKPPKLDISLSKPLHKKNLIVSDAAIHKSGVIYLSRVPPFMKPQKLRSLLEPYGQINRIFLAPEDPSEHARRVKSGGNKKRSYSEGWVEFLKKKDAKKVVDLLNAQTVGGKKSSWYRDDVWSLKYLSGFKWHHLTEQIAAENAEKQSRMRAEISKSTKENKEFAKNVERAKVLNGMEAKKAGKRKKGGDEDDGEAEGGRGVKEDVEGGEAKQQRRRTFAQVQTVKKRKAEEQGGDQVQRVLSKIF